MTFREFCDMKANDPRENIFPKETTAEEAIMILKDHFLGPNWYITYPGNKGQIITEIVGEILRRNPKMKDKFKFSFFKKHFKAAKAGDKKQ